MTWPRFCSSNTSTDTLVVPIFLGSPYLHVTVLSSDVYSSFTDLLQKKKMKIKNKKNMIFWLFYVLNFFLYFFFFL